MIAELNPPTLQLLVSGLPVSDELPRKPSDEVPIDPESSFALVLRAKRGDEHALNILFERYSKRLQIWAHGRLPAFARGAADTQDLVQETLIQVIRNLGTFEPQHEGAFLGYVRRTLRNGIIDRVRQSQRRGGVEPLSSQQPSAEPSPFDVTVASELMDRYEVALERLKPEYREAIIARIEFRLSWPEVAAELKKPSVPAAQMTVSRALVRLAREMSDARLS
jgi:RNA polymerase sigma-70 factor (ECF subfamily)